MENKSRFRPTGHKDIDELFAKAQCLVENGELLREAIQKALSKNLDERDLFTDFQKQRRLKMR